MFSLSPLMHYPLSILILNPFKSIFKMSIKIFNCKVLFLLRLFSPTLFFVSENEAVETLTVREGKR